MIILKHLPNIVLMFKAPIKLTKFVPYN